LKVKPVNLAQKYLAYQKSWKKMMIKQLEQTTKDRIKREDYLKQKPKEVPGQE
jgi:phage-related minor tail protein